MAVVVQQERWVNIVSFFCLFPWVGLIVKCGEFWARRVGKDSGRAVVWLIWSYYAIMFLLISSISDENCWCSCTQVCQKVLGRISLFLIDHIAQSARLFKDSFYVCKGFICSLYHKTSKSFYESDYGWSHQNLILQVNGLHALWVPILLPILSPLIQERTSWWKSYPFLNKDLEPYAFSLQMVWSQVLRFVSLIPPAVPWHTRVVLRYYPYPDHSCPMTLEERGADLVGWVSH